MKVKAIFGTLALGLLFAQPAFAQEPSDTEPEKFDVDKDRAKVGATVWSAKACMSCHTIGKGSLAAPDLNGLYERREIAWVRAWLKDPEAMYETDETAKAMIEEWYGLRMPDFKLTDAEIDALMHYIAEQQKTPAPQKSRD